MEETECKICGKKIKRDGYALCRECRIDEWLKELDERVTNLEERIQRTRKM